MTLEMKFKLLSLMFLISLCLLLSLSLVSATVGIGIKWFSESEYVNEGSTKCINYGLYNPFDREVYGYLTGTGELEPLYSAEEPKPIPPSTSSQNAIPTEICFKIPKNVYPKSCILGMMCEIDCSSIPEKVYTGEVVGQYTIEIVGSGSGSSAGSSFAAPLRLKVKCESKQRNWLPLILILIVIIGAIVAWWFMKKKRQKF